MYRIFHSSRKANTDNVALTSEAQEHSEILPNATLHPSLTRTCLLPLFTLLTYDVGDTWQPIRRGHYNGWIDYYREQREAHYVSLF